jgi:Tyrosyl-DNA phosphodiesterase
MLEQHAESRSLSLHRDLSTSPNGTKVKSSSAPNSEASGLPAISDVLSYRQQKSMLATGIQFPDGIVKKTWVYGCPRQDDIKIEEVFQKDDLELAVLSSFLWDDEWTLSKLNLQKTKVICVVQAQREEQVSQYFDYMASYR